MTIDTKKAGAFFTTLLSFALFASALMLAIIAAMSLADRFWPSYRLVTMQPIDMAYLAAVIWGLSNAQK